MNILALVLPRVVGARGSVMPDNDWLRYYGDSRDNIGGRCTDISQIAVSLYDRTKQSFLINEVPEEVVEQWKQLHLALTQAEKLLFDGP